MNTSGATRFNHLDFGALLLQDGPWDDLTVPAGIGQHQRRFAPDEAVPGQRNSARSLSIVRIVDSLYAPAPNGLSQPRLQPPLGRKEGGVQEVRIHLREPRRSRRAEAQVSWPKPLMDDSFLTPFPLRAAAEFDLFVSAPQRTRHPNRIRIAPVGRHQTMSILKRNRCTGSSPNSR